MNKILFVWHGTTVDSRELTVFVVQIGQSVAFATVGYYGFTMSEETKKVVKIRVFRCPCYIRNSGKSAKSGSALIGPLNFA